MRVLAVDPGEKRIGLAISDPSGTIANPLTVIKHVSRLMDAAAIASIAAEREAGLILIGQALDDEGQATPQSRHSVRLAEAVRVQSTIPVLLWEESYSTQEARTARINLGASRRKRRGHLDDLAATVILQSYLNQISSQRPTT